MSSLVYQKASHQTKEVFKILHNSVNIRLKCLRTLKNEKNNIIIYNNDVMYMQNKFWD